MCHNHDIMRPRPDRMDRACPPAFTLVELLIVVSIVAALIAIVLPSLRGARDQARAAVCGSNIRQLAIANTAYATEHSGRYCPGAANMRPAPGRPANLHRWHGTRESAGEPFDAQNGPLTPYLTADEGIRACPSFRGFVEAPAAAFEEGCGGYGYNLAYLGRVQRVKSNGAFEVIDDTLGVPADRVRRPGETAMFADTAFAGDGGVIEYSFAEPRFQPEFLHRRFRADPSIHFRHRGRTSVAWADGHVDMRRMTHSWHSGLYPENPRQHGIGWFGQADDNSLFDLE